MTSRLPHDATSRSGSFPAPAYTADRSIGEAISTITPPPYLQFLRADRVVRVLLALVLLVAAGFKAYGLALGPTSGPVMFSAPWMQVGIIEIESLLGLWLLGGWSARAARIVAIGFFGLLASVSLYLALAGQRSCGCFGRVAISPWWTFAFDVAVIGILLIVRPARRTEAQGRLLPALVRVLAGAVALLVITAGVSVLFVPDVNGVLANLRGEWISVEPSTAQIGDGVVGEQRQITIAIKNYSDKPVRIVGGTSDFMCLATDDQPITIFPHESESIHVCMRFRGGTGLFQHRFLFYTDSIQQQTVSAQFAGRVVQVSD